MRSTNGILWTWVILVSLTLCYPATYNTTNGGELAARSGDQSRDDSPEYDPKYEADHEGDGSDSPPPGLRGPSPDRQSYDAGEEDNEESSFFGDSDLDDGKRFTHSPSSMDPNQSDVSSGEYPPSPENPSSNNGASVRKIPSHSPTSSSPQSSNGDGGAPIDAKS